VLPDELCLPLPWYDDGWWYDDVPVLPEPLHWWCCDELLAYVSLWSF